MSFEERRHVGNGAFLTGVATGAFAYFHYREFIKKEFRRSEAHHRFEQKLTNMTPWKQLYMFWHRMPDQEYNVYYKFAPFFLIGQLDLSKEILIPRRKYIEGQWFDGFDVINPLYCYEGGKLSLRTAVTGEGDPVSIERAAIVVNRGWIHAKYRDKRSRPHEVNTMQLVKINGTFRKGKNVHDYKVPNDPNSNEWNNLALEDIGIYWGLPNFDEQKYFYFHSVDFVGRHTDSLSEMNSPVIRDKIDDVIDDHYGWRLNERTNRHLFQSFGFASLVSFGMWVLTVL
jgi:hypothetical protein